MKVCPKCGYRESDRMCTRCGERIRVAHKYKRLGPNTPHHLDCRNPDRYPKAKRRQERG